MTSAEREQLLQAALDARQHAHAPYSEFYVGAALLTSSGKTFAGVNVENASYGLTICAERVAMSSAIAAGEREFKAIAVSSTGGVSPCGACRQFLAEFSADMPVLMIKVEDESVKETTVNKLLPDRFTLDF